MIWRIARTGLISDKFASRWHYSTGDHKLALKACNSSSEWKMFLHWWSGTLGLRSCRIGFGAVWITTTGAPFPRKKNVCFVFGSGFSSYLLILLFASSASSYLLIALKCMQVRVKSCSIKVCMSHRFCIDSSCFILFSVTCCQRSNNPSLLCSKACGPCEFLISCFGITLCRFSSNRHGLVRLWPTLWTSSYLSLSPKRHTEWESCNRRPATWCVSWTSLSFGIDVYCVRKWWSIASVYRRIALLCSRWSLR